MAKMVDVFGVTYPSLSEACRQLNVNEAITRQYIYANGLSPEEAITLTKKRNHISDDIPIVYNGRKFRSLKFLCEFQNVSCGNVRKLMRYGLTLEEAIEHEKEFGIGCHDRKILKTV